MSSARSARTGQRRGRGRGQDRDAAKGEEGLRTPRRNKTSNNSSPITPHAKGFSPKTSQARNRDVGRRASHMSERHGPPIPMADFPRQEDLRHMQMTMSVNMHDLQPVRQPSGPATANDFQSLLAGISKLEGRDRLQTPGSRVSLDHEQRPQIPVNSPIKDPLRLGKILDAIAGFCVSREKGEVVALGMEASPGSVNFMIATNSDVPQATTAKQLQDIWQSLKSITAETSRQAPTKENEKTPRKSSVSCTVRDQLTNFARLCLSYSFQKWRKRVNGKLAFFKEIPYSDLPRTHPFIKVRGYIRRLFEVYASSTAEIGEPSDKDSWLRFTVHLRDTEKTIQEFFDTDPFLGDTSKRYAKFPSLQRYLRKIAGTLKQLDILTRAARSPRCKHIFAVPFNIQTLPPISTKATAVPRSVKDWESVFERAAGVQYNMYDMDMHVISEDAAYMSREAISMHTTVHCELKIALQAMKNGNKMYSYIGVSKLSCRGCQVWLCAFNELHETHFCTRGSHGKAYYPWQIPQNFPNNSEVTKVAYRLLATSWLTTYHGYRPKKVEHGPDSTVPSRPSGPEEAGDRDLYAVFVPSLLESLPDTPWTD